MTRFCANCGTEVDDNAVFCPTCGQPIDQDVETEMPPAPSWPEPEPRSGPSWRAASQDDEPEPAFVQSPPSDQRGWPSEADGPEETRVVDPQPRSEAESPARGMPEPPAARHSIPPPAPPEPARPPVELPLTMPVTLSGWLIGGGAALGAIGALIAVFDGLGTAIDLLLLVALLAVTASVFLSERLPSIPQLRLVTMAVALVAFGVALDRLGFGRAGAGDLLLFLGTAAAAIGAIILETGRDQPMGGPSA